MTHVINPMLFYWSSVSDTAKAVSMVAAIAIGIACLLCFIIGVGNITYALSYGGNEDSDDYKMGIKSLKWAQKCIVPLVILLMLSIFIPSEKNTVQNNGCKRCYIREY